MIITPTTILSYQTWCCDSQAAVSRQHDVCWVSQGFRFIQAALDSAKLLKKIIIYFKGWTMIQWTENQRMFGRIKKKNIFINITTL